MKNEKLLEAMGYMDEGFLAENMDQRPASRKRISFGFRNLRNLTAAVLAVALLAGVVLANTVSATAPDWEPYADADTVIDYLFGTGRYSMSEGGVQIKTVWEGIMEDGSAKPKEVRIPITSSASREPVSEELAAMVKPYLIPVEKTITDPTGTITLEVMTYFYEPETGCGVAYVRLSDPTGAFGGYVLDPPVVDAGTEIAENVPKGIETYLQIREQSWGKAYPSWHMAGMRFVEEASDEYHWTFVFNFWTDEDTVDISIGFETELWRDSPQWRVKIDLNRKPTMETITLKNAIMQETVILSPVSILIDGTDSKTARSVVSQIVIFFKDGSSYVARDDEGCVYGIASGGGYQNLAEGRYVGFLFSNIIDITQVSHVQIEGVNYPLVNP